MDGKTATKLVAAQRAFFASGRTFDLAFRKKQLIKLHKCIRGDEPMILAALAKDLHKPAAEAYLAEVHAVLADIELALAKLDEWARPRSAPTPLALFPSSAAVIPEPLGVVLVIAPWNYPFQLAFAPLIAAVAAGNCVILSPSTQSSATAKAMHKIISENFDPGFITSIVGGKETNQAIIAEGVDYLFFTGGTEAGRAVAAAAGAELTPMTLELGGKSPCIVDSTADIAVAGKRIAWGKFLNAGQTCIAPDFVLVDKRVKAELLRHMRMAIKEFYNDAQHSKDYCRIINEAHFERLKAFIPKGGVLVGGHVDASDLFIEPTIIDASLEHPIMGEEIFGPILPLIAVEGIDEAIEAINSLPKPLAVYLFSRDRGAQKRVIAETSSGGVCINDTLVQAACGLPFGGVGESGFGRYHGKAGFDTFSNLKSVLRRGTWPDFGERYPPYKKTLPQLKRLLKILG